MPRMRTNVAVTAALILGALMIVPAVAQEEPVAEGAVVDVIGVEYTYEGMPTSIPAGTTLTFTNAGVEVHEMGLSRIADSTTESVEELLAMQAEGRDILAEGLVENVGDDEAIVAVPGTTADGSFTLDREGRYVILCFIPTGMDLSKLEEFGVDPSTLGPDTDITTLPPEAEAFIIEVSANPPHVVQGMIQEFFVTAAVTDVGPLPESEMEASAEDGAATTDN